MYLFNNRLTLKYTSVNVGQICIFSEIEIEKLILTLNISSSFVNKADPN